VNTYVYSEVFSVAQPVHDVAIDGEAPKQREEFPRRVLVFSFRPASEAWRAEGFVGTGDASFGAESASGLAQAFTTQANSMQIGAPTGVAQPTVDDVRLDAGAMPGLSAS